MSTQDDSNENTLTLENIEEVESPKFKLFHSSNKRLHKQEQFRCIKVNSPQETIFISNWISNTKYSIITFIPKNLFEQFRRIANIYFLIVCALALTPYSPYKAGPTILAFAFVLVSNAIKEAVEDIRRYRQDKEINNRTSLVLRDSQFQTICWKDINVGDIIKVQKNQSFPADLLILSSSLKEGNCYVETSNLDGETNLKIFQALKATSSFTAPEQLQNLKGDFYCEIPSSDIYKFSGSLKLEHPKIEDTLPIGIQQLLIRGTTLRNTEWITGLVIYTGKETKYVMNSTAPPSKRSHVERYINKLLYTLLAFQIILTLICTIVSNIWESKYGQYHWYLSLDESNFSRIVGRYINFYLLFNGIVPVSLYVTVEFVRVGQALFLYWDSKMYDPETKSGLTPRTSNLNEELAQIRYLLTDKTGTLTANEMVLKLVSINEEIYGSFNNSNQELATDKKFRDQNLTELLKQDTKHSETLIHFFRIISLCHSAIPEIEIETDETPHLEAKENDIKYQAPSPDELALVNGAKDIGIRFEQRSVESISIDVLGKKETYEILDTIDFTSDRKRMSIILKTPKGDIWLLCKGADSTIGERLAPNQSIDAISQNILQFASVGLRILSIAWKEIDTNSFSEWKMSRDKANMLFGTEKEKERERLAELIERDLILVGVTAIEDKLQEGVPETIESLLQANIKIWMLTGDKQETAINVAKSCRLIRENMDVIILQENVNIMEEIETLIPQVTRNNQQFSLVIAGKALTFALSTDVRQRFCDLASLASSVICCRTTPLQKSLVVNLVKELKKEITLAIGDGANDVSMIQKADIGIGLVGKEGTQAALAADFSFGKFRFLKRLLLVHGRWSYWRVSILILYMFYKQFLGTIMQFWFMFLNAYSGQTLYDSLVALFYVLLYTSIPIGVQAIYDRDVGAEVLMEYPSVYVEGQNNIYLNARRFWAWILHACFSSASIFYTCIYVSNSPRHDGKLDGFWYESMQIYFITTIIVSLKLLLEMKSITWIHHLSIWGSIAFTMVSMIVLSSISTTYTQELIGVMQHVYTNSQTYFLIIITTCFCLLPDIVYKYVRRTYFPYPHHILQEIQQQRRKEKEHLPEEFLF